MLKITNRMLKAEAERRGWSVKIIDESNGVLEYSTPAGKKLFFQSSLTPFVPATTLKIADNKKVLYRVAEENNVPIPKTVEVTSAEDVTDLLEQYTSLVVKPNDGAHGDGVVIGVNSIEKAEQAINVAMKYSSRVLAQQEVTGQDYRLLFIDYKLAAACIRKPAFIIGDGQKSIRELVDEANASDKRAANYMKSLNFIDMSAVERFLAEGIDRVPAENEEVIVVGTANIGTGGEAVDITKKVSPSMEEVGRKIMKVLDMPMGAVDFMGTDEEFYLLEINATPSFGLHLNPSSGESQPVDRLFFDWIARVTE